MLYESNTTKILPRYLNVTKQNKTVRNEEVKLGHFIVKKGPYTVFIKKVFPTVSRE